MFFSNIISLRPTNDIILVTAPDLGAILALTIDIDALPKVIEIPRMAPTTGGEVG